VTPPQKKRLIYFFLERSFSLIHGTLVSVSSVCQALGDTKTIQISVLSLTNNHIKQGEGWDRTTFKERGMGLWGKEVNSEGEDPEDSLRR
jgi:hypothetical protein